MKKWAKENIKTKPVSKFPNLNFRIPPQHQAQATINQVHTNDIRQFLIPLNPPPHPDRPAPTDTPPPQLARRHQPANMIKRYFPPRRLDNN